VVVPDDHDRLVAFRHARVESVGDGHAVSIAIDPPFTGSEGRDEQKSSRDDLSGRRRSAVRGIEDEVIAGGQERKCDKENDEGEADGKRARLGAPRVGRVRMGIPAHGHLARAIVSGKTADPQAWKPVARFMSFSTAD